jgi:hypothetical protein
VQRTGGGAPAQLAAECALPRPVFLGEFLADQDDGVRIVGIVRIEHPARDERDAHHRQVTRRDPLEMEHRGVRRKFAVDQLRVKRAAPLAVADRQRAGKTVAGEGRLAREVLLEGSHQLRALFVRTVGRLGKLQVKHRAVLAGETQRHAAQFFKAHAGQRRADQNQHRDGGLYHDHRLLPAQAVATEPAAARLAAQRVHQRGAPRLPRG